MKIIMVREKLNKKNKKELVDIIIAYDKYIQEANDDDKYIEEWRPVCISEFIDNDLEFYIEKGEK